MLAWGFGDFKGGEIFPWRNYPLRNCPRAKFPPPLYAKKEGEGEGEGQGRGMGFGCCTALLLGPGIMNRGAVLGFEPSLPTSQRLGMRGRLTGQ